jgi:hypothetical protein
MLGTSCCDVSHGTGSLSEQESLHFANSSFGIINFDLIGGEIGKSVSGLLKEYAELL